MFPHMIERGSWDALHEVELPQGRLRYRDVGEGEHTVVLLHGVLVNGTLWRKVAPALRGARVIVPDLPLGAHGIAMRPDADLTPGGVARLIADFLEALDLHDVVLAGNDTGGALAQLVATRHPERIGRLVLTPCDAFERFFPPLFKPLQIAAKVPGGLTAAIAPLRLRPLRRLPVAFGWLAKRPIDPEVSDGWVNAYLADAGVRRDARKAIGAISTRYTLDAAEKLPAFGKPAMVLWSPDDRVFPIADGERLAALLDAKLVRVPDSYTFMPEDQPGALAEAINDFVREPAAVA